MAHLADYMAEIEQRRPVLDWRHELIAPTGELLATTNRDEAEGDVRHWSATFTPIAWQNDRVSNRNASLSVETDDPALIPDASGSLLHPRSGNQIRAWAGLVLDDEKEWAPQGTYLASRIDGQSSGGVTSLKIPLVDTLRPVRSNLISAFAFDDGDLVEDAVSRLLTQAFGPGGSFTVAPMGGCDLPAGSFSTAEGRLELIEELLVGCGYELTTTPLGHPFTRRIPPTTSDDFVETWEYGDGGIPIEKATRVWPTSVPQGYRIKAGSLQNTDNGFEVTAWDSDPSSQGYFDGPGETTVVELTLPFVRSEVQGIEAGYGQLRRYGVGPGIIEIETIPNPFIKENDMVSLTLPALHGTGLYRAIGFNLPIQVDGFMSILLRGVYNPALGYDGNSPTIPSGPGFQVSFIDDFNRPDENLEDWPEGAGSPDWTEHGFSWAVVNNQAIQRHDRTWSFAVVNTAMKNTDHRAEIEVVMIPTGRLLGPVVRSSREFDGYYAKASSTGLVTLESWLAGKRIATLGEFNTGGGIDGQTLAIQAVGRTVTVELNDATIITAEDDGRTGAHVGMLAYGGWTGNAPTVDSFTAGVST